jgi:hypothetical protein
MRVARPAANIGAAIAPVETAREKATGQAKRHRQQTGGRHNKSFHIHPRSIIAEAAGGATRRGMQTVWH